MHIILHRQNLTSHGIDGALYINGHHICDTTENKKAHLKPGSYNIILHRCLFYKRKMPVIITCQTEENPLPCDRCKFLHRPSTHGNLPCICPQIKFGNGAANRNDGTIIIGEKYLDGVLLNSAVHFDQLIDRLEKAKKRGEKILITIRDYTNK